MKKLLLTATLAAVTFVALAQNKTINKSFSNIKSVRATLGSSDVLFKHASGSEVKLTVEYDFDEGKYTPSIEDNGGKLVLKEEFKGKNVNGNAKWTLEIPDDISIDVNSGSGSIELNDLKGKLKANTGSGEVSLKKVKGDLKLNAGSGSLKIDEIDGEISANVGSGRITVSNSNGELSFNAGSGSISIENTKGSFSVNVGSGEIKARSITLAGSSKFNSGSGDATVVLGASPDHDISVNSGSGDATLDFAGNEISGEVVMSASKKKGKIVAPFKFDKEEEVKEGGSDPIIRKTAKLGAKEIQIKVSTGSGTAEIKK